jgi:serine/threonine protein kinase
VVLTRGVSCGSLLGSGSFADVYRAEWRMPCAVKKMKGRISKEMMTEFVREGEMMRSLKHPGIVKLLGVCVEGGSFYLVQVPARQAVGANACSKLLF